MDLLKEVLAGIRRLEDEPEQDTDLDLDLEADPLPDNDSTDMSLDEPEQDPLTSDDLDQEIDPETDDALDNIANTALENPNKRGLIRTVKNAHLVYKRETGEGTYEELWIYNVTSLRDELSVKKAILAGTDIPVNKMTSPDGSQTYEVWSIGNAEMILIKGLPN